METNLQNNSRNQKIKERRLKEDFIKIWRQKNSHLRFFGNRLDLTMKEKTREREREKDREKESESEWNVVVMNKEAKKN